MIAAPPDSGHDRRDRLADPGQPHPGDPRRDPRNGWRATVREHRRRVQTDLTPRIAQILASELSRLYAMAREDAAAGMRDHGEVAAADALSESCPDTVEQTTGDWWP